MILSEIYLGTIWCGQVVFIDIDVTMATNLWHSIIFFQKMENPIFKWKKNYFSDNIIYLCFQLMLVSF